MGQFNRLTTQQNLELLFHVHSEAQVAIVRAAGRIPIDDLPKTYADMANDDYAHAYAVNDMFNILAAIDECYNPNKAGLVMKFGTEYMLARNALYHHVGPNIYPQQLAFDLVF